MSGKALVVAGLACVNQHLIARDPLYKGAMERLRERIPTPLLPSHAAFHPRSTATAHHSTCIPPLLPSHAVLDAAWVPHGAQ
eukprot:610178-Pelagomonas_calceolata.AAC.4